MVYLGGLVVAAGWDLATRSIPNLLVGLIAVAAAGRQLLSAPAAFPSHGMVALAVLGGGIVLFALKLWGAGDAKLLAAAAILIGSKGLPLLLVATALAGGLLAVLALGARLLLKHRSSVSGLPYGVAIACGAIVAVLGTTGLRPLSGL